MTWRRWWPLLAVVAVAALVTTGLSVSPAHAATPPAGPPGWISATPASGGAHVQWGPVADATSFEVTADPGGATCRSTTTGCLLTGLVDGTPTSFTVTATNDGGTSVPSSPSNVVTPQADVDPPQVVSVDLSTDRVPASGGVVTVRLHITEDGSGVQTSPPPSVAFNPAFGPRTHAAMPLALESGTTTDGIWRVDYPFDNGSQMGWLVMSISGLSDVAGHTGFALPRLVGVAFGSTSAVTGLTTTQTADRKLHLAWSPPADDGGSPITGYAITTMQPGDPIRAAYSPLAGVIAAYLPATTTSWEYDASWMGASVPYQWAVAAINGAGVSPAAVSTGIVRATAVAPGPARIQQIVAGDHALTVSVGGPAKDGGATVTRYLVRTSPGGRTCIPAPTQPSGTLVCTITGLASDVPYTVTATGWNSVGGAESEPQTAIPTGLVDAPPTVIATAVDGGLHVAWTPPADGSAADGFQIVAVPEASTASRLHAGATADAREVLLPGAVAGVRYHVSVRALLAGTTSEQSVDASVLVPTRGGTPSVGGVAVLARRATSIRVAWFAAPTGTDRIEVDLQRGTRVVRRTTLAGSATSVLLGRLTSGTTYRCAVRVHSASGWSAPVIVQMSTRAR